MTGLQNLCNPDGSCAGNCHQGDCLGSVRASRAALWMQPLRPADLAAGQRALHAEDGGMRVSGSDSLRLRIERAAEPEPTSRWLDAIVGAVIVLACILAAACMGVQIHF